MNGHPFFDPQAPSKSKEQPVAVFNATKFSSELHNYRLAPQSAKRDFVMKLLSGTVSTLVFMLAHHFFLSVLESRLAGEREQFWLKAASNAFSQVVVLFMSIVATAILAQLVCR